MFGFVPTFERAMLIHKASLTQRREDAKAALTGAARRLALS